MEAALAKPRYNLAVENKVNMMLSPSHKSSRSWKTSTVAATAIVLALSSLPGPATAAGAAREIAGEPTTMPLVSEELSPVERLQLTDTAYAAVRKPPGKGPFPAVLFLHGGLGQSKMETLVKNAIHQPTQARFLAWGYVTVNATRRSIRRDPEDRGVVIDTLAIIEAVKKMPAVDADSVALYGGSGGGTLALELAGKADLAAVVAGEPATIIYMGMFTKAHVIVDANGKVTGDRRWDVMNADAKALYTPELRAHTRSKLAKIECPVLILHGDQHQLGKFNLGVFVPEMKAMNKPVEVRMYAGERHGFYWGQGDNSAMALKANQDADAFLRKHIKVQPSPLDPSKTKLVAVTGRRTARDDSRD